MDLITDEHREQLLANANGSNPSEHAPVVKLFHAGGAGLWLLVALDPGDPDMAFGLADLGVGCPELGCISLSELRAMRGFAGLGVERDPDFTGKRPLIEHARASWAAGRLIERLPSTPETAAPAAA